MVVVLTDRTMPMVGVQRFSLRARRHKVKDHSPVQTPRMIKMPVRMPIRLQPRPM